MPLMYDGVPSAIYLVPIKVTCVIFAIAIGTPLYYGSIRMPLFDSYRRILKYGILVFVVIIVSYIIATFLYYNFNVDITPFLGMDFIE
ncbi:hypothetical protein [Vallitalea longa]|uniref:hypothetical protein n=1 Tax=Vallitalea longa TaxID=2936439 RepID=UPI002492A2B0|nr:hypothetical protein [Vallitalea longa]